jgi:Rrf2 family protein
MRLSTRTRYATRALAALAAATVTPVSVRELAESEHISAKYLEHIFHRLNSVGLLRAVRGKCGGYELAKPAASITLKDVFVVFEGTIALECTDDPDRCPMVSTCATRQTWVELKEAILRVLERTTLEDLAERKRAHAADKSFVYEI